MRILIAYASAGIGHRKAAEAIYKSFKVGFPSNEVYIVDSLDYSNIIFRWGYPRTYLFLINYLSLIWGFLYYLTDFKYLDSIFSWPRRAFHRLNGIGFEKFLLGLNPEAVICTHFFPSEVTAELKKDKRFGGRLITVVTDFRLHSFWVSREPDFFVVASDETKKDLLDRGIREERVKVLGIPVDPVFSETKLKEALLKRLDLRENFFNILLVSGGFGVGPIKELVLGFDRLKDRIGSELQLIVICGRNKRLFNELTLLQKRLRIENKIYPFVDNMDEFMQVSDIMITKSGGITISEALSKSLPMIIIRPILGQETRNSAILLQYGVALKANWVFGACRIVKSLIESSERLYGMRARSKVFAHPDAAMEIAKFILQPKGWVPT